MSQATRIDRSDPWIAGDLLNSQAKPLSQKCEGNIHLARILITKNGEHFLQDGHHKIPAILSTAGFIGSCEWNQKHQPSEVLNGATIRILAHSYNIVKTKDGNVNFLIVVDTWQLVTAAGQESFTEHLIDVNMVETVRKYLWDCLATLMSDSGSSQNFLHESGNQILFAQVRLASQSNSQNLSTLVKLANQSDSQNCSTKVKLTNQSSSQNLSSLVWVANQKDSQNLAIQNNSQKLSTPIRQPSYSDSQNLSALFRLAHQAIDCSQRHQCSQSVTSSCQVGTCSQLQQQHKPVDTSTASFTSTDCSNNISCVTSSSSRLANSMSLVQVKQSAASANFAHQDSSSNTLQDSHNENDLHSDTKHELTLQTDSACLQDNICLQKEILTQCQQKHNISTHDVAADSISPTQLLELMAQESVQDIHEKPGHLGERGGDVLQPPSLWDLLVSSDQQQALAHVPDGSQPAADSQHTSFLAGGRGGDVLQPPSLWDLLVSSDQQQALAHLPEWQSSYSSSASVPSILKGSSSLVPDKKSSSELDSLFSQPTVRDDKRHNCHLPVNSPVPCLPTDGNIQEDFIQHRKDSVLDVNSNSRKFCHRQNSCEHELDRSSSSSLFSDTEHDLSPPSGICNSHLGSNDVKHQQLQTSTRGKHESYRFIPNQITLKSNVSVVVRLSNEIVLENSGVQIEKSRAQIGTEKSGVQVRIEKSGAHVGTEKSDVHIGTEKSGAQVGIEKKGAPTNSQSQRDEVHNSQINTVEQITELQHVDNEACMKSFIEQQDTCKNRKSSQNQIPMTTLEREDKDWCHEIQSQISEVRTGQQNTKKSCVTTGMKSGFIDLSASSDDIYMISGDDANSNSENLSSIDSDIIIIPSTDSQNHVPLTDSKNLIQATVYTSCDPRDISLSADSGDHLLTQSENILPSSDEPKNILSVKSENILPSSDANYIILSTDSKNTSQSTDSEHPTSATGSENVILPTYLNSISSAEPTSRILSVNSENMLHSDLQKIIPSTGSKNTSQSLGSKSIMLADPQNSQNLDPYYGHLPSGGTKSLTNVQLARSQASKPSSLDVVSTFQRINGKEHTSQHDWITQGHCLTTTSYVKTTSPDADDKTACHTSQLDWMTQGNRPCLTNTSCVKTISDPNHETAYAGQGLKGTLSYQKISGLKPLCGHNVGNGEPTKDSLNSPKSDQSCLPVHCNSGDTLCNSAAPEAVHEIILGNTQAMVSEGINQLDVSFPPQKPQLKKPPDCFGCSGKCQTRQTSMKDLVKDNNAAFYDVHVPSIVPHITEHKRQQILPNKKNNEKLASNRTRSNRIQCNKQRKLNGDLSLMSRKKKRLSVHVTEIGNFDVNVQKIQVLEQSVHKKRGKFSSKENHRKNIQSVTCFTNIRERESDKSNSMQGLDKSGQILEFPRVKRTKTTVVSNKQRKARNKLNYFKHTGNECNNTLQATSVIKTSPGASDWTSLGPVLNSDCEDINSLSTPFAAASLPVPVLDSSPESGEENITSNRCLTLQPQQDSNRDKSIANNRCLTLQPQQDSNRDTSITSNRCLTLQPQQDSNKEATEQSISLSSQISALSFPDSCSAVTPESQGFTIYLQDEMGDWPTESSTSFVQEQTDSVVSDEGSLGVLARLDQSVASMVSYVCHGQFL